MVRLTERTSLMVCKFPYRQSISFVAKHIRKIVPVFGLLTCCAVSPAFAGETAVAAASDQPASAQMMNNSIDAQLLVLQSSLENSRHIDAQTTRLDKLIRVQMRQEKILKKISDDLKMLVQLQIGRLQQDAQSSSTTAQRH